jgi:hypothetical protein
MDAKQGGDGDALDRYICERCEKKLHIDEKTEHDDWHFAKDLQEQDGGAVAPAPVNPAPQSKSGSKKSDANGKEQPPGYGNLSHSSANGSSRLTHQHTNQVIEAARIRARDEVRLLIWDQLT